MLGRNAAGIFWMFRYLERSENIARIMLQQAKHYSFPMDSIIFEDSESGSV